MNFKCTICGAVWETIPPDAVNLGKQMLAEISDFAPDDLNPGMRIARRVRVAVEMMEEETK